MPSVTARIRRLNSSGDPLYVSFDRVELDAAGLEHGEHARLELTHGAVTGIVKTTGATPWLAPHADFIDRG